MDAIRWGQILAAVKGLHPPKDACEVIFEVNVVEPDGLALHAAGIGTIPYMRFQKGRDKHQ